MQFDFTHFNFLKILWTFGVAAHVVLLVVLLGREDQGLADGHARAHRFPFFTTFVALDTVRILSVYLLYRRLTIAPFYWLSFTLSDVVALVQLLTLIELTRRIWPAATLRRRILCALAAVALGALAVAFWTPWPSFKNMAFDTPAAKLMVMQWSSQKFDEWVNFLTAFLGIATLTASGLFHNLRSHARQIALGLGLYTFTLVGVQKVSLLIAAHAHPKNTAEYNRYITLFGVLANGRSVVYLLILIALILLLWQDEKPQPSAQLES